MGTCGISEVEHRLDDRPASVMHIVNVRKGFSESQAVAWVGQSKQLSLLVTWRIPLGSTPRVPGTLPNVLQWGPMTFQSSSWSPAKETCGISEVEQMVDD